MEKLKARISLIEMMSLVLLSWGIFVMSYLIRAFSGAKYWVVTGSIFPYIYILLLLGFLGKRGLRISKEFAVSLVFVLALFTGKAFLFAGSPDVNFLNIVAGTYSSVIVSWFYPTWAREYVSKFLPSWLVPQVESAVLAYYQGGANPDWSVFAAPIISWTLVLISVIFVTWPMIFLILGPHWFEIERLQFPMSVPAIYITNEVFPSEEENNWLSIIDFKRARVKAFWAAFTIGLILNLPFILSQVLPEVPLGGIIGGGYGTYPVSLYQYVRDWLPSSHMDGQLVLYLALLYALLPLDLSISIAITGMFFGLVYRPLVVRMGIVSGVDPGQVWPIPHLEFRVGAYIGLGLIALWVTRERWIKAFKSLKKDFDVDGFSMKIGLLLMLAGTILLVGIFTVAGGNLGMMLIWFIIFTIINIGCAYIWANSIWLGGDCHGYMSWRLGHYIGSSINVWSAAAPQENSALAIYGLACGTMGTCAGAYQSNSFIAQPLVSIAYGYAKATGSDMRKVLIYTLITCVTLVPFALVVNTYVNCHVGILNTSESSMDVYYWGVMSMTFDTGVRRLTYATGRLPFGEYWGATIISAAIVIVVYWLRSIFPWFFLHPVGIAIGFAGSGGWNHWLNMVIGISTRILLNKTLGPKRTMDYLVPILSGLAVGLGSLYLIVGLFVASTISIPNLLMLWK
ncbi:MAG: DUF6785 family protein [Candidatus Bathyarchaeia archaeon]|nr:hypothetical protein [Candidatus Bathyarchaeota archaeon]